MGFCTKCGATLDNEARFCESCGAPIATAAGDRRRESINVEQTPVQAAPAATIRGRGFALWVTALLAAGGLFIGVGLGWMAGVAHASRQAPAPEVVSTAATEGTETSLLGALTGYNRYVVRTQVYEGVSLADGPKVAVTEYYSVNGRFPSSNHEAGLGAADTITGKYVASVGIESRSGVVRITFSRQANAAIAGRILAFVPAAHAGSIEWSCMPAETTVPREYLPTSCTPN